VLTAAIVAVKLPVAAPAATVTVAGTPTAESLLATLTANPPLGAATFNVIVQLSVPAPVIDELPQLSPLNTGTLVLPWLDAFSCRPKFSVTPPWLAVSVTICAVLTAAMVDVKLALVAPAATVTDAGTVTAPLLLARLTPNPPLGAASFKVIEQLSVPAPVIDERLQLSPLNTGGFVLPWLAALSCNASVSATPPALAVSVTV
jgi:hypothetical protein